MPETDDIQLLRDFTEHQSDAAFAALVTRHVNLVYSVAQRQTGNPHAAEEITQAVFIILARKAASLGPKTILSGWLYQTARLTAANFLRGQIRRQQREQEAYMQSVLNESSPNADETWLRIAPLLDAALGKLSERDRHAIVLRFFENRSLGEVGAALGATEDAAKMRVNRALEKLRRIFSKRGVMLTATLIAGAVSANSVQAAPVGLAVTVAATAAKGTAVAASIAALVKGTMKMMTWLKLKFAVGVGVAAILAGGAVAVALSGSNVDETTDPAAEAILNKAFEKYASLSSYSDSGKSFTGVSTNTFSIKLGRPDLYRMEWDAVGTRSGFSGTAWSAGDGHFRFFKTWGNSPGRYQRMKGLGETFEFVANISGGAAFTIPPVFFGKTVSDGFGLLGLCSNFLKRDDAKIGDVDCYVLTGHLKSWRDLPVTLWIGKDDLLIHQIQRTTIEPVAVMPVKVEIRQIVQTAGALFSAKKRKPMVHTEIHENIVVNQPFAKESFIYPVPAGLQPWEK